MMPIRMTTITRHEHRTCAPRGFGVDTLAARLAMVMMSAAATTLTVAAHADEVVLKDHTMSVWDGLMVSHRYMEPNHHANMGASVPFTSNGGTLSRIGIVWAHVSLDGNATCNGGSTSNWNWRFMYWPSKADYLNDPWGDNPNGSVTVHTFSNPTNPDWYTQIGTAGCYHLYYAEVDVGFLNITLPTNGQTAHVMLVPDLPGAAATASGRLAFSNGSGAIGMEPDWYVNIQIGPDTFENLDLPQPWSAYRITATSPKSPCIAADLNCDGVVNVSDLLILLGAWGACTEPDACPADLNDDGVVNVSDLLILLSNWG